MRAFNRFVFKGFLIVTVVFPFCLSESSESSELNSNRISDQETENRRNIFDVFDETIDKRIENPLSNPKYKAVLDRADGISNFSRPKTAISLEESGKVLHKISIYSTEASLLSSSSESYEDSTSNENIISDPDYPSKVKEIFRNDVEALDMSAIEKPNEVPFRDLTLKRVLRTSCVKAASHACAKACKKVLKGACGDYKCSKGLKKEFKKECKKNCKTRFHVESSSSCRQGGQASRC